MECYEYHIQEICTKEPIKIKGRIVYRIKYPGDNSRYFLYIPPIEEYTDALVYYHGSRQSA